MTDDVATAVDRALTDHEALEPVAATGDSLATAAVTSTEFQGRIERLASGESSDAYALTVRAPTLEAATVDHVGSAVAVGWFETLQRRLGDAPGATRYDVDLDGFGVAEVGETVVVTYEFSHADPTAAASIAKTFTEYVEGTYVEGVVPGYEYEGPVADLVGRAAANGGDGQAGGTPL